MYICKYIHYNDIYTFADFTLSQSSIIYYVKYSTLTHSYNQVDSYK